MKLVTLYRGWIATCIAVVLLVALLGHSQDAWAIDVSPWCFRIVKGELNTEGPVGPCLGYNISHFW